MAPGRAGLTVYEYPRRLIRLTNSSCLQQTNLVCVEYLSLFWWSLPTRTFIYLLAERTSNVIKEKCALTYWNLVDKVIFTVYYDVL